MSYTPHTKIFIHRPYHASRSVYDAYPHVFKTARHDNVKQYPHMSPKSPAGSSHEAIIHHLSHNRALAPLHHVSPTALRTLRGVAHSQRVASTTVHVFGLLDNDSPFGSRRLLESLVRELAGLGLRVQLHVGVWDPTPREFRQGLKELLTIQRDNVVLASLFPVKELISIHNGFVAYYINQLRDGAAAQKHEPTLPLQTAFVFPGAHLSPNDQFVMANHDLHGLDTLVVSLEHEFGAPTLSLDAYEIQPPDHHMEHLNKQRHYVAVSARPTSYRAYFGSIADHPYFDAYHLNDSVDALEMLLSPHFGYHAKPFETTIFLDEDRDLRSDRLLSLYLGKINNESGHYSCYIVEPTQLHDITLITNTRERA